MATGRRLPTSGARGYGPAMGRVRSGELSWTKIDDLHRMILDTLVPEFGLQSLTAVELDDLNLAWHRLMPWPDGGRRPDPAQDRLRPRDPVQWQCGTAREHGEGTPACRGTRYCQRSWRRPTSQTLRST